MNRAIDKPSEHVELTGAGGDPIIVQWQTENEPKQIEGKVIEIEVEPEKNGND